jgi:hypothetical protein
MDPEDVKKISNPALRAYYERHQTRSVSIVIEDIDSVRVDPNAPGSPTPPWHIQRLGVTVTDFLDEMSPTD